MEQFAAFAALGLQYYSIRFIDLGDGVKNVMQLTKAEVSKVRKLQNEYGLNVSSIGSPIGKVKLEDVDDGHIQQVHTLQEVPGKGRQEGLRSCARL